MLKDYLLDRLKEAVIIVDKERELPNTSLLGINAYACEILKCSKEDFLLHATAEFEGGLEFIFQDQKGMLKVHGGSLFQSRLFQFEAYEDVYGDRPCWVLMGKFIGEDSFDSNAVNSLFERALWNSAKDAIIIVDSEFHIQSWNPVANELYGWDINRPNGKVLDDIIITNYLNGSREEIWKRLDEVGFWEGEVKQRDGFNEWVYILSRLENIKDDHGKVVGRLIINRDVSAHYEFEMELKASEERLKLAGKAAYDLLYEWIPATGQLTWFGDIDGMLGYPQGSISNDINAWLALIHPEDQKILEEAVLHHTNSTNPIKYEYRVQHIEGHYLHWWDHGLPILDEERKPIKWIGICVDQTEKKESFRELNDKGKLLTIIGENFPKSYLSVIYPDFTIGYTNGQEFKNQGIDPRQFVRMNCKDVFSVYGEDIANFILEAYSKTFLGEEQTFELTINGEIQEYNTVPIRGEDGEVQSMLAVVRNVTNERQREILIQESEEKFSKAFHEHSVPMMIMDIQTCERIDLNKSYIRLTGYEPDAVGLEDLKHLDICLDKDCMSKVIEILKKDGKIDHFPAILLDKKGINRHVLVSGAIMEVGVGHLAILSLEDITQRKKTEELLRNSESRLKTLVETLPDLFWLKDLEGVYLACNRRFSQMYGAPEEEIIGKTDRDFVSEEMASFFRKHDLEAISAGYPKKNEEVLTFHSDGHKEHVETIKAPVYNGKGNLVGVMGIARDITDRIKQLDAIKKQNDILKNIAWMQSHEVRAPLTNIMGLISLMEYDESPSPEELEFIYKGVVRSAHELDAIIRNIIIQTEEYMWVLEGQDHGQLTAYKDPG